MAGAAELEREIGFGPLLAARVNMHAEQVEAHPQHGLEVGQEVLFVVDGDAVQKVRPRQQPAPGEPRPAGPRPVVRRQQELRRRLDGITFAVDAEEGALAFEEIEHRQRQGGIVAGGEAQLVWPGGDLVRFAILEAPRLEPEARRQLAFAGPHPCFSEPHFGRQAEVFQPAHQLPRGEPGAETRLFSRLHQDALEFLAPERQCCGGPHGGQLEELPAALRHDGEHRITGRLRR